MILLQRRLAGQENYLTTTLRNRARSVDKTPRITWWCNEEFTFADCYAPTAIPENDDVAAWMKKANIQPAALRTGTATGRFFSSDAARRMIESEFLIAGAKILGNRDSTCIGARDVSGD